VRLIWQLATVTAVDQDGLELTFDSLTTCDRCLRGEGCGAGVFSRLFARRRASLRLPGEHDYQPGQRLRVGLSARAMVAAALLVYGAPLLAFLLFALVGHVWVGEQAFRDAIALAAGLIGAALVFVLLRAWPALRLNPCLEPLSCSARESTLE
jgi:sigma-E factor negative regulatory protein RseC